MWYAVQASYCCIAIGAEQDYQYFGDSMSVSHWMKWSKSLKKENISLDLFWWHFVCGEVKMELWFISKKVKRYVKFSSSNHYRVNGFITWSSNLLFLGSRPLSWSVTKKDPVTSHTIMNSRVTLQSQGYQLMRPMKQLNHGGKVPTNWELKYVLLPEDEIPDTVLRKKWDNYLMHKGMMVKDVSNAMKSQGSLMMYLFLLKIDKNYLCVNRTAFSNI